MELQSVPMSGPASGPDGPFVIDEMADLYPEMDQPADDMDAVRLMAPAE